MKLTVTERTITLPCPACHQRCTHTVMTVNLPGAHPNVECGNCGHVTEG